MTQQPPAGLGRKRPLLNVAIARLHLDPDNPHLPENIQGKDEEALRQQLYTHFDLEEIALPMGQNGYLFDEEPLVAIPQGLPLDLHPCAGSRVVSPAYLDFLKACQKRNSP